MKIRTGFVSNSSTASFIVRIKQDDWHNEKDELFIANEEDVIKLEEYGFERTDLTNPFKTRGVFVNEKDSDKYLSMKYFVTCNEDEVIEFLVKNNIPFKASVHYDHRYVSYKKDSNYVFQATNYGLIFNMYGENHFDYLTEEQLEEFILKPYRKIPKSEYLDEK